MPQPLGHLCCMVHRHTQAWVTTFPAVANPAPGKGIVIHMGPEASHAVGLLSLITGTGFCHPSCWLSPPGLDRSCPTSYPHDSSSDQVPTSSLQSSIVCNSVTAHPLSPRLPAHRQHKQSPSMSSPKIQHTKAPLGLCQECSHKLA